MAENLNALRWRFWNTSLACWELSPYMVKEYSIRFESPEDVWLCSVVSVPVPKKDKAGNILIGDDGLPLHDFIPMGVRLESISDRKSYTKETGWAFVVPGRTMFAKYPKKPPKGKKGDPPRPPTGPIMVSSVSGWTFVTDCCGRPTDAWKGTPQMAKPKTGKVSGTKPLDQCEPWVARACALAEESYAAYVAMKRAA